MNKEYQSCGFGNNLGPTNSNFDSFYKNGTANSVNLNCKIYGNQTASRFGKKRFIQEAFKSIAKKGTKGSFTRWCKRQGYPKATTACIKRGKRSQNLKIKRKAIFAQNIRSKSRHYSFGKSTVDSDIRYLKSI
jgi:hypothetical protein